MITFPRLFVSMVVIVVRVVQALARSRAELVLENLILRQQVTALQRERPRPHLDDVDRGVLVAFRKSWAGWATRLSIVTPQTVVKWHRRRFRRYWTRLSHENRRAGRPRLSAELRKLIRTMALDPSAWPRSGQSRSEPKASAKHGTPEEAATAGARLGSTVSL